MGTSNASGRTEILEKLKAQVLKGSTYAERRSLANATHSGLLQELIRRSKKTLRLGLGSAMVTIAWLLLSGLSGSQQQGWTWFYRLAIVSLVVWVAIVVVDYFLLIRFIRQVEAALGNGLGDSPPPGEKE